MACVALPSSLGLSLFFLALSPLSSQNNLNKIIDFFNINSKQENIDQKPKTKCKKPDNKKERDKTENNYIFAASACFLVESELSFA